MKIVYTNFSKITDYVVHLLGTVKVYYNNYFGNLLKVHMCAQVNKLDILSAMV